MLDLYSLTSSDFNAVLSEFPVMQSILANVAVERLQRLNKYSDEARQNQVKRYVFDMA
jgi:CRP-like cAMP-binding protein